MNRNTFRSLVGPLLGLAALCLLACSKEKSPDVAATPPPASPQQSATKAVTAASVTPATTPDAFACGLLTAEEVQAVQGEPFRSTKAGAGPAPGLSVSQCYFELPTPANSIVLTVTRKGAEANARDPKESWREIFYGERKEKEKEEGEGERKGPEKIEGLGDEAFWTGNRIGGALYVLKGDCYIRISVGGAGDQEQKTEKSKTLAAAVLKRLP